MAEDDGFEMENSTQALTIDYLDADMIMYKFEYVNEVDFENPTSWELWDLVTSMLGTLRPEMQSILPDEAPMVERILKQFGDEFRLTTAKASTPDHQRPMDWLEKNGVFVSIIWKRESRRPRGLEPLPRDPWKVGQSLRRCLSCKSIETAYK